MAFAAGSRRAKARGDRAVEDEIKHDIHVTTAIGGAGLPGDSAIEAVAEAAEREREQRRRIGADSHAERADHAQSETDKGYRIRTHTPQHQPGGDPVQDRIDHPAHHPVQHCSPSR